MHTRAHIIHSLKCIHRFVCVCAASCIVVVSKIKRLVVRTRADAREIYSNVDAWGCMQQRLQQRWKRKKLTTNGDDEDRMSCVCVIYFCWLSLALRAIFNLMNDVSTTVQASIDLAWHAARKIRRRLHCTTHVYIHICAFARIDAIDQVSGSTYIAKKKNLFLFIL
jgi:hypothetical protein